jgi:molybdopterin-guanine dinucleotide biosynthesis protein A
MGRPKAFIEIDGLCLMQRALNALSGAVDRLLIVAAERESFAGFGLPVALDDYPGLGPLAGIHAALKAASGDSCLIAACDQPFLAPALLAALVAKAGAGAVVPRVDGRLQPFPAVYPPSALPFAEASLSRGELRLASFLGALDPLVLEEPDCRGLDPGLLSFVNLNTPAELEAVAFCAKKVD